MALDPFSLIGGIAAPLIGGLIGQGQAAGAETAAENARKDALRQYAQINVPDIESQKVDLGLQSVVGEYTPELEAQIQQQQSEMQGLSTDPRLRTSQMAALQQLSGLASTGMTPADQAAFTMVARNAAQADQAKQGQILQEMQARGQGGSGAELIAKLKGAQAEADAIQQAQMQQAQIQQAARMQALAQQGQMGGNMRTQDFSEGSQKAQAQDAINQFNANMLANQQNRNVGAKNMAQQQNLGNKQTIANTNVGTRNQQEMYNKGLIQQNFQNQLQRANGMSGQYNNMAGAAQNQAAGIAGMWGGLGQGAGTAISSFNTANATDNLAKALKGG